MANRVKIKQSPVQGKVPVVGDLVLGELAVNTYDGKLYTKKNDGADAVIELGKAVAVSATAPSSPAEGDLWYDTVEARTFIWTGSEWADSSPDAGFPTTATGDNAPANPESGDLWYRTSDGRMYVYYNDGSTSQWVDTNPNTTPVNDTFERTGTDVTLVNTGDNVGIGTTPAVKLDVSGEIRASTGILFGTDTAATNTLDDYEEGTWTPAFQNGSWTYTDQTGYYTKIGNVVTAWLSVSWSSRPNGENVTLSLPFTSATGVEQSGTISANGMHNYQSAEYELGCSVGSGSSNLTAHVLRDGVARETVSSTDFQLNTTFTASISYRV